MGKVYENLNCRYEGVKFAYLSDFLASRRYDIFANKVNGGTFDIKQYADYPLVIHL